MTSEQFRRVLKELAILPPSEELFQLLLRKYLDRGNAREVCYTAFCADVDRPEDIRREYAAKNPAPPSAVLAGQLRDAGSSYYAGPTADLDVVHNRFMQQRVDQACNPADVEERLRAAVVMRRVRIEEFFNDFDKLRKGRVTKGQFQQVLSMLNFSLTPDEYGTLCARYKTADPEYLIDYVAFCASVNKAFTTYGIQKDPLASVAPVTVEASLPARRKYLDVDPATNERLEALLAAYREAVRIKRIHLKPMLQDFDITKNQHVTKHQFLRTLAILGVSAPPDDLNILLKRYLDKGNADEVNYFDFCQDVDSGDALFQAGRDFNHSFDYYPKNKPRVTGNDISKATPNDVDDVIARLRTRCVEQRVRIAEFFRDFDKLRKGHITEAQFRIGLNMSKIVLSGAEFRLLADHFAASAQPGCVQWRAFADCVDEVFTKKGLERSVDIALGDARTQSFYGTVAPDAADRACVDAFCDRFKALVQRERLDAKSFFQDQDRHHHMKVSPKQFRQTCELLRCGASEEEVAALVRVYGNKQGDIEYLRFLQDTNVLKYTIAEPWTGAKSTYRATDVDFTGAATVDALLTKIKDQVKAHRIRLGEFLRDHDPLRKGAIEATKFRTTLYAQKIQLTVEEYQRLEDHYRDPKDARLVRY